jgi:hypothetical protein
MCNLIGSLNILLVVFIFLSVNYYIVSKDNLKNNKDNIQKSKNSKIQKVKTNELNLKLLCSIPIAKFLRDKMSDLKEIKHLNFEDIEDYFHFEGGDDFRYPQLYYVDSSTIVFFNPYHKRLYFKPSIDFFSLKGFNFIGNEYYNEGFTDIESAIKNNYSDFIKTNTFDNKEFLNAINLPKGINKLFIKDRSTNKIIEVNINCHSDYYGLTGYQRYETNYGTYDLQQAIYFCPYPNYIFLTNDDFNTIFIYDYSKNESITCSDIRKVFGFGLFLGITKLGNIVLYDKYDSEIKIINKEASLLKHFILIDTEIKLEALTMFFNNFNNTLYYTGFDEESMSIKIFFTELNFKI